MARHRPFTDGAGYTRHCWECRHARGWGEGASSHVSTATCELTGRAVDRYRSPDNQCCGLPPECDYETGGGR